MIPDGLGLVRRYADSRADLKPALGLVLADDALVPVHLALDPVLKYATRLGELLNNFVATFALSTMTRRKVQGLPYGKFMRSHVLLQHASAAVSGGTLRHLAYET